MSSILGNGCGLGTTFSSGLEQLKEINLNSENYGDSGGVSQFVRLTCLNVILANKDTLPAILSRTRNRIDRISEKASVSWPKN